LGWGYVAVNTATSDVRAYGAPWSAEFREKHGQKLRRSTFTEPQGLVNAACHLLTGANNARVRFGTDSTVTQASCKRGFNTHSLDINDCLLRLRNYFGASFVFEFVHIPGVDNLADCVSRGKSANEVDRKATGEGVRRQLGLSSQPGSTPGFEN
jgi:hypothetical protein